MSIHARLEDFLNANDFTPNSIKAIRHDFSKWVRWFETANRETYLDERVTSRDVADFRRHLREVRRQAVATVNRCLVSLRRYFGFLVNRGVLQANPAEAVKELRRVLGPPKAVERSKVRKILREATIRGDRRTLAVISLMLYAGLRVGEVSALELADLDLTDRSGSVRVRNGKGNKERSVPLGTEARRAMQAYLTVRPATVDTRMFVGKGGRPLGTDGIRYMVKRYGIAAGMRLNPHALRHTMATEYLAAANNDLVGLAQLLGHGSIQTSARYAQRTSDQLQAAAESISF